MLELAYNKEDRGASAGRDVNAPPSSSSPTSASSSEAGTAPTPGGEKGHRVAIDPSNPLHKMLPETDCEFCLDTREKLWGMMKGMKGMTGAKAGGDGTAAAAKPGHNGVLGADAAPNPSPS